MIIASCRKNFTKDAGLADKTAYRNYTNPTSINAFKDLTRDEVLEQATNKHICIFVHGFKNPMENVMNAYWQLAQTMKDSEVTGPAAYGLVIGFAWPGFQTAIGFFPALLTSKKAAPFLRDLINDLRTVALSVDVQTHSLGARVAFTALSNPKKTFVDNLITTAAAVDNNKLELDKDFHAALGSCNRCFVYHSKNDPVLKIGFTIGDIFDGIHKALGLTGPASKAKTLKDCPNVFVVDCSARVDSHGGYRKAKQYFDHWKDLLSGKAMSQYDELN